MSDFYQRTPEQQAEGFEMLALAALDRWGIKEPELTLIKMRENAVFRVDAPGQPPVALRIHRHQYHSDDSLRSELLWMKALEQAGIDVPRVIPSTAGNLFEKVASAPVPEARQVDLFQWIEGDQLGASGQGLAAGSDALDATFHTLGELCARVHNQSATWQLPGGFERHAWDAEGLTGEQPFWGRFWELEALTEPQRRLIGEARSSVHRELLALGKASDIYSVIHADLTPENVMVHEGNVQIIDFDDAGFGWHLFEIATALYFHQREPYFHSVRDAMVRGYREHRDLPDEMLALLPTFMMARGFTYLGWVHTRQETETARELTPMLVDLACGLAEEYLHK